MLDWLAAWLQQIIAVVLLAGVIDLLLPNKSMQRYVRLVAGLIILLTIMTPIMRLLQGDFDARLDRNMENWFRGDGVKEMHMPTLQDIQRNAAALERQSQASAAALAQRQLEEAMQALLAKQTGLQSVAVAVKLDASAARGDPGAAVASVTVTLPAASNNAEEAGAEADKGGEASAPGSDGESADEEDESVKNVDPVDVTVQVDSPDGSGDEAVEAFARTSDYVPVEGAAADAIRRMLSDGWAIDPKAVTIRRPQSADS